MFPLRRTWAEIQNQTSESNNSDSERTLSGVWVSFELQKGVEKGYIVTKRDEVWHFEEKTDDHWQQEAPGYPNFAKGNESRVRCTEDYCAKDGIRLNPSKIGVNKAKRRINKLLLRSLWDRFSMRENLPTCKLVADAEQLSATCLATCMTLDNFRLYLMTWLLLSDG